MAATPTRKKAPAAKSAAGKSVAKKATASSAPAKTASGKRPTPKVDSTTEITILTPDDQGWNETLGRRHGRRDVVTPVLTPILHELLDNGQTEFQLEDRNPFTVYQVRGWSKRMAENGTLPDGVEKIRVTGGSQNDEDDPRNIHVTIIMSA